MTTQKRQGFTLVELLVVIAIIGMLMALLIPAVVSAVENARQVTCTNNQGELAKALIQFENRREHLPGYVNTIPKQANPVGWVVPILEFMGRTDLWEEWREGGTPAVELAVLICPSDETFADQAMSYAVNTGQPGDGDTQATGLFHNRTIAQPINSQIDLIPDGASQTVMLTENIQAGYWTHVEEQRVGTTWRGSPNPCSRINRCNDQGTDPNNMEYARPSSNHPGGVHVTYADGRCVFVQEDINYNLYKQELAPNDRRAGL